MLMTWFSGPDPIWDPITNALQSGQSAQLGIKFNNTVELSINGTEGAYSKGQGEMVLRDFFQKNKPSRFIIQHKGNSGGTGTFANGQLETAGGTFRVYILQKNSGGQYLIHELRIEIR